MKNWKVMSHSQTGSSHVKSQKPNQDACLYKTCPTFIGAVSDGHGSIAHARSDIGSSLAVASAMESIEFFLNENTFDCFKAAYFKTIESAQPLMETEKIDALKILIANVLPHKIVANWRQKVLMHHAQSEKTEHVDSVLETFDRAYTESEIYKLYGCTLLCAFEYDQYMIFLQIGDGLIGIYEQEGKVIHPILEDARHKDNITTSISDFYAPLAFKTAIYPFRASTEFIALTTDGVENAYPNSASDYIYFYHAVHGLIVEALPDLEQLLERTSRYSGDDSTALILYRPLQSESDFKQSESDAKMYSDVQHNEKNVEDASILYAGVPEGYVPIEHLLSDPMSSSFLEIAGELCYSFDQFEVSGFCIVGLALQDIWYDPIENRMLLVSKILRAATPQIILESRKLLADLLYLIYYKVYPAFEVALVAEPQQRILIFDEAYAEALEKAYTPRKWIHTVDQIRQAAHFNYEWGKFNFDGQIDPHPLSLTTQLGSYEIFHDSTLFLHQILKSKKITNHKIAKVVVHPKRPQIWGLQNNSNHEWIQYIKGNSTPRYIPRGKTATLIENSVIFMYGIPVRIVPNIEKVSSSKGLSLK
ncbi:protein phosphatase 2C domain-containing protein [Fusibacter ferrireducens]|uniref:Protein phosphatase 2C domain-containing protein n=1 Tax=Fusibacter ferrireducens TaxID=2785058 RepID=A0ABR9ZUH0_9FIRM|nr:protein phosphatase 2C domain-containing protein [Fusibacter ferrireducens]MBF4694108.1 protein phosphatase 2C domain-containing protein [Fusibacter ferrireducens]